MIIAILIGRRGSRGFPGKNIHKVLGRRLCEYPLLAAKKSKYIDKIFVSTDCPVITRVGKKYGASIIKRPRKLADHKALGDHVFEQSYFQIKKILGVKANEIDSLVLLMANAPTITHRLIDKGIKILKNNKKYDSAVTTSVYNMWSPPRARKLQKGFLKPFVPFSTFGGSKNFNCDRDSQGNVYYADMSVSVVRPKCLENLKSGLLPQKWMGKKIAPIKSWGGLDLDFEWQIPLVEHWLKKNGYRKK